MAKPKIKYVDAKRNYQSVKYYPFDNAPGDPFVLTSDPWFYLKAWLNKEIHMVKKTTPHKKKLEKAVYFAELAENFQQAANSTVLPTKGTLAYYSVLNLVKTFLLTRDYDLETQIEYHGLSLPSTQSNQLKIAPLAEKGGINIFQAFSLELGSPVYPGSSIHLDDMISEIVEVHEMCFNLGKLKTGKRKFLPINIRILTSEDKYDKITYEVAFEKKNGHLMRTEKFQTGNLNLKLAKFNAEDERKDWSIYRSVTVQTLSNKSNLSWCRRYRQICLEIEELGVSAMLTRNGYRYYLNLQPNEYKPQVYFFALMYYIGSIARYRPTLVSEVLEGEYSAILNEVMETCPKQFLYSMVSLITKKVCAVPMSKLD